ncbi:tRNA modification GTPase MnmE isoform X4 [Parasteatoda tepidariorum]|uniref:tRNA modification GTPase MnmE isoform X3 n=1 Tax=Parasteatoda tepidariorum TaxID=114398 RepID=UPI001C7193B1|nr:tRNA modification GTPase MnmE isoform X3 [Parasteatoda tepidariorum]
MNVDFGRKFLYHLSSIYMKLQNSLNKVSSPVSRSYCYLNRSTIFALSTPPGVSAIAVVRISGPHALNVLLKMGKLTDPPPARKAILCKLRDPETGELLDKALTLWFPSPNSFTGEDSCELHIHGGTAVIKSVLTALSKLQQFRFAEPGEFTKRAFLAGKLDLTEVEALADLLNAETEGQQRQALRQMEGALFKLYSDWSGRLKQILASLEAYIDFSEDQHLDDSIFITVNHDLASLKKKISLHLTDERRGEKVRNGVNVVLIGKPNVGKSSLMNNLCKRDIAIVSSHAGTTRDIIESSLNLGGYLVSLCDTAGIRETCNSVEEEGVRRAKDRSSKADLLLFIIEAERAVTLYKSYSGIEKDFKNYLLTEDLGIDFVKENYLDGLSDNKSCPSVFILLNKRDLLKPDDLQVISEIEESVPLACSISCTDGNGMETFVTLFSNSIKEICCSHSGEEPAITQQRHRHHLEKCLQYIIEYENAIEMDIAIAADYLRNAMNELGKITGRVRVEDILDIVFQRFCIGK